MEDSHFDKKSILPKTIPISHAIYVIIICIIFIIFTILIIPRCISDDAYQNFSFAATIVSIVLAVVSIVYSLQSGLSSVSQFNGIREIETRIGAELNRFSNLETSIQNKVKEIVEPIQVSLGDIKHQQVDIQKAQDALASNWKEVTQNTENASEDTKQDGEPTELIGKDIPQILYVIFYVCALSKKTGKDLPFHILAKLFGTRSSYYCEGVINSLSILNPTKLKIQTGSKPTRKTIDIYDEQAYGSIDLLSKKIEDGKNTKLGIDILQKLNQYFDSNDDDNHDSV
jgi:hypothetical protein